MGADTTCRSSEVADEQPMNQVAVREAGREIRRLATGSMAGCDNPSLRMVQHAKTVNGQNGLTCMW